MQVSVEKISNVERRLTIVVPVNQVEEAYTKHINKIAKTINIKGFRPGKAPLSFIQQRYGDDARKDALSDVIQDALTTAIREQQLKPISLPKVEPKVMADHQPLEFIASFEVMPEIEKIAFAMEHIEKLTVAVETEDVEYVIQQLLKQHTNWQVVEREAQLKDRVVIDYYAIFEGLSDDKNKIENYPLELGSKLMMPGFEDGLVGAKAGDERTLSLTFPAESTHEDKAGKAVTFEVKVKQVLEAHAPNRDENFVQKLGVESGKEEDLREQIKQSLEQERDRLVREKLKEQVFQQLIEQNPIDVPPSLIAREASNIHDEFYPQHKHHDHHQHSEQETAAFNDIAKKRVILGLLIAEYASKLHLKPDDNRVRERIQLIAAGYENPQEVIDYLSSGEHLRGMEAQVMEDQVVDKLIDGMPVTEKIITYAELKGIRE